MDWSPQNISSDNVPFNNFTSRSTVPELCQPISELISELIESTPVPTCSPGDPLSHNLFAQLSGDLLDFDPFDRHPYHDPIERKEHQHVTMRDDLGRDTLMPTRSAFPCSACNGGRQRWATGPSSGLLNTHGRPEQIDRDETFRSWVCKWENCRKPFKSKGALMRHIDTQHIAPRSFKCQSCNRLFSRKDNMEEHIRRIHWVRV
ncbi:Zinc finger C2H2 [Penicillium longicatenatum]|nr:Zinc finger C2H2 [Penicillium longicatenatum]